MLTVKVDLGLTNSVNRAIDDKALDIISSKDSGGLSDGLTNDSTSVNNGVVDLAAAYSAGVLIIPVHTVYTEGSLILNTNISILDFSIPGVIRVLSHDEGSTLPITKGGLEIRTQGISGIILSNHDSGVAANPYLRLLNKDTGALAGLLGSFISLSQYIDFTEIASPSAPAANTGRLFVQDNGAGKSQLCVRFNTGAIQVLATQP